MSTRVEVRDDLTFMQHAIDLARRGTGSVSPNPLVGCVVVRDGEIAGEGWHIAPGGSHAEIAALEAAGPLAAGSTVYVNLEPCAHHGRTPPCTEALIRAGVTRVVYATADPNPVAAGGESVLRAAGIRVERGLAEREALHLNRFFFHHLQTGRPLVIAKFATSLDGRVATRTGHSQWITGSAARQRGHELRRAVDAILVGSGTVIADDPALTVRLADTETGVDPSWHPMRVVLDRRGRLTGDARVLSGMLPGRSLLVTDTGIDPGRIPALNTRGIEVWHQHADDASLDGLLARLGARGVQSLMVEGGPSVMGSFLDQKLIDEVWNFLSPRLLGGNEARSAIGGLGVERLEQAGRLVDYAIDRLDDDLLIHGRLSQTAGSV